MNSKSFNNSTESACEYSRLYLEQYWPDKPISPEGWADNVLLMLAYQEAALNLAEKLRLLKFKLLDISTGPALAPILAMHSLISDVQMSDFYSSNRQALANCPIEYWKNYVPMLIKLHKHPEERIDEILNELSILRDMHSPVEIDLFQDNPLPGNIDSKKFDVISMHFVADSITSNISEYFKCLSKVTSMLRIGGGFIMSSIVDGDSWQLGSFEQPSPKVSENQIVEFLTNQGIKITYLTRSIRHPGLTFNGGWIVLCGVKN